MLLLLLVLGPLLLLVRLLRCRIVQLGRSLLFLQPLLDSFDLIEWLHTSRQVQEKVVFLALVC